MVKDRVKVEIAADGIGGGGQVGMVQDGHPAAALADEMVVRGAGDDLELEMALTQVGAAQDPQLAQGLEGAIDGGQIDVGAVAAGVGMNLLDAGVAVQFGQSLENDRSLPGQAEALLPEPVY
jgi:hypothetical protein